MACKEYELMVIIESNSAPTYEEFKQLHRTQIHWFSTFFMLPKISIGCPSCDSITPILEIDSSHSASNNFSKLGKAETRADVNLSLIKLNLFLTSVVHKKFHFFMQ